MSSVERPAERGIDIALGAAAVALEAGVSARRRLAPVTRPLGRFLLHPPGLPQAAQPAHLIDSAAKVGRSRRAALAAEVSRVLDTLVPAVLAEVLRRARLTEQVIRYVDLDAVVAAVDLDKAVARVDLDRAVARVDVEAVVDRVDLDDAVSGVDVEAIVARVDVDAVARRLDLDAVVARLDLTQLVLERVDLAAVAEAVLATIDLPGIASQVIDEIDLPGIIRESSGSMASDTVRSARMQGIAADQAVGRAVDRLLLRRTPRD
jgi:hypothetical protein